MCLCILRCSSSACFIRIGPRLCSAACMPSELSTISIYLHASPFLLVSLTYSTPLSQVDWPCFRQIHHASDAPIYPPPRYSDTREHLFTDYWDRLSFSLLLLSLSLLLSLGHIQTRSFTHSFHPFIYSQLFFSSLMFSRCCCYILLLLLLPPTPTPSSPSPSSPPPHTFSLSTLRCRCRKEI